MQDSSSPLQWVDGRTLQVGSRRLLGLRDDDTMDHLLQLSKARSNADRFVSMKSPALYERVLALVQEFAPQRILEIGLFQGGSTVFLCETATPALLVGLELADERIAELDVYAAEKAPGCVIDVRYGVDQGDVATVASIVDDVFGDALIDMVLDDASHVLAETTRCLEAVFPRVRPGGCYVIEDWSWAHADFENMGMPQPAGQPLRPLVLDLVGAAGVPGSGVAEVRVDIHHATIVRSEDVLAPGWTVEGAVAPLARRRAS